MFAIIKLSLHFLDHTVCLSRQQLFVFLYLYGISTGKCYDTGCRFIYCNVEKLCRFVCMLKTRVNLLCNLSNSLICCKFVKNSVFPLSGNKFVLEISSIFNCIVILSIWIWFIILSKIITILLFAGSYLQVINTVVMHT